RTIAERFPRRTVPEIALGWPISEILPWWPLAEWFPRRTVSKIALWWPISKSLPRRPVPKIALWRTIAEIPARWPLRKITLRGPFANWLRSGWRRLSFHFRFHFRRRSRFARYRRLQGPRPLLQLTRRRRSPRHRPLSLLLCLRSLFRLFRRRSPQHLIHQQRDRPHFTHIMHAHDMGAIQDRRRHCARRCIQRFALGR